jgi:hypothetical protein
LSALAGITAFLAAVEASFQMSPYVSLLLGLGALIAFGYLAIVALHPAALGVLIAPEVGPGEEAIGIFSFLLRLLLRGVPVAFGVGVIVGALTIAYVCGLGLGLSGAEKAASEGPQAAKTLRDILETATLARGSLLRCAALPLAAYLAFLLGNLILSLWGAVLSLPAKIDGLATKNKE